jgi:hypothetical protein
MSVQPPEPSREIDARSASISTVAVVAVGVALTGSGAVRRLLATGPSLAALDTLIISDRRRHGRVSGGAFRVVVNEWSAHAKITIGLPPGAASEPPDPRTITLASAGWARVRFADQATILTHCDVPIELPDWPVTVAISMPAGDGVIRLWRDYVHPNTLLRIMTHLSAAVEPAVAIPASYVLLGRVGTLFLACHAGDPIAAELVARGIERLRVQSRGAEAIGPWEDPGVQRLTEFAAGVTSPSRLVLRVALPDNLPHAVATLGRLGELLSCAIEIVSVADGEESGGSDDEH